MDSDRINSEAIIHSHTPLPATWKVTESLWLPPEECVRFQGLARLFRKHQEDENPKTEKPLSVAVFGPPGSGKSHAVKQLAKSSDLSATLMFNLSQMAGPEELIAAFRRVSDAVAWSKTPLVFFDEFDSELSGQPLGWLQWFLAPMEDGEFTDNGLVRKLKRCVFGFGGGTTPRYEEFKDRHAAHFINAKGPDFISRLSDYINIKDPNEEPREVRRAILIRTFLEKHLDFKSSDYIEDIPPTFLDQLLKVGRYRHGIRSIEAIVRMIDKAKWDFRDRSQLRLHVDGGPLEGLVVALSAGGPASSSKDAHGKVAHTLLRDAASLIYGGAPLHLQDSAEGQAWVDNYVAQLAEALSRRPPSLFGEQSLLRNVLATGVARPETEPPGVEYYPLDTLTEGDLMRLGLGYPPHELKHPSKAASDDWAKTQLAWSFSLFRMRAYLMRKADGVIVMTGREFGSRGRFPGVTEEVMMALAFNKPVYLVGGFGGAAEAVGRVLGLSQVWLGMPSCLTPQAHIHQEPKYEEFFKLLACWKDDFVLPFCSALPHDYQALCTFLGERAPGTSGWPDNGLTLPESQELFRATAPDEIARLICRGLHSRFGR